MSEYLLRESIEQERLQVKYQAPKAQFVPVVIRNKLLFKYDPVRGLIEIQERGEKHLIDLADYCVD